MAGEGEGEGEVQEGEGAVEAFLGAEPPPAASLAGWLPPAEQPGLIKPYIFLNCFLS